MSEPSEPQPGPLGGMLAATPHAEEVPEVSEGMSELSEPQQGPQAGMLAFATSGGMTLDHSDKMSEGMQSVMTAGISASMDAFSTAEPVVQAPGMGASLSVSSSGWPGSIRPHERWGRRVRHPAEFDCED